MWIAPKKATIKQAYDNDIISDGMKYNNYDDGKQNNVLNIRINNIK